jgi:hypothetical protein
MIAGMKAKTAGRAQVSREFTMGAGVVPRRVDLGSRRSAASGFVAA